MMAEREIVKREDAMNAVYMEPVKVKTELDMDKYGVWQVTTPAIYLTGRPNGFNALVSVMTSDGEKYFATSFGIGRDGILREKGKMIQVSDSGTHNLCTQIFEENFEEDKE